jgi:hypothetical protein
MVEGKESVKGEDVGEGNGRTIRLICRMRASLRGRATRA